MMPILMVVLVTPGALAKSPRVLAPAWPSEAPAISVEASSVVTPMAALYVFAGVANALVTEPAVAYLLGTVGALAFDGGELIRPYAGEVAHATGHR